MVRWGILGAGNIAHRFAAALLQEPNSQLVAVSARKEERASAFAAQFGAARYYTDHNALLAEEEVDAIYLALPHGLHKEWAVAALRAGKAVLCEKPAVVCAEELREIAAVSRETGNLFMEAMKTRFVPLYAKAKALVESGAIGQLQRIDTTLCNLSQFDPDNTYLTQPGQGGILLDCGCYCVCWLEEYLPELPQVTQAFCRTQYGVDSYVKAELQAGGVSATLECAFDEKKPRTALLIGSKGSILVDELHRSQKMTVCREGFPPEVIECPYEVDDFYSQIAAFVRTLESGAAENSVMPLEASLRCAQILDAVRAAMRES